MLKKKIYILQPTYRRMDGSKIKGWTMFNHSLFLPIFSAVIPKDWEKQTCLEYYNDIDYETDASVILISCMGYDIMYANEIAQNFKQLGKKIIFGAHWDEFSEKILTKVCDAVFYGFPSPENMAELLHDILIGKPEKTYNFGININYPFDYSVLKGMKFPFMQVQASIGCKHDCSYCCASQTYRRKYFLRRINYVISDLKTISKMSRFASLMDQNLYNNPKYTKMLCERIIQEKIKIIWGGQCTPDIGNDPELLGLLKRAGCRILFLGLESLQQDSLNQLNKKFPSEAYMSQIMAIRKSGIFVVGYFILGLDGDNVNSFDKLYRFAVKSGMKIPIINILIPVPGTKIFYDLKDSCRLLINDEKEFAEDNPLYSVPSNLPFYKPAQMTTDEIREGIRTLGKKLFALNHIIRRSLTTNPAYSYVLYKMNMDLRRKYYAMK
jgi:radical SAM superfamily enzyme YgiQ (UPF0313 family)